MDNQNRDPYKIYCRKQRIPTETANVIKGKLYDKVDDITNKITDLHPNSSLGNLVQISQKTFLLSLSR